MAKQLPPSTLLLLLSQQHVHNLIWIMFLLQVPPVINGVPFRTMAKSGLYWLTLIIDSRCLLPWFMIVCYFYISCQIHLVSPWPGSASANSKHPSPSPPLPPTTHIHTHTQMFSVKMLFSVKYDSMGEIETHPGYFSNRFRKERFSLWTLCFYLYC